jgi:ATP-dependent Clp endopeptidase proteolytic subunit ClpP
MMANIDAMIADAASLRSRLEAKQRTITPSAPWYSITNAAGDVASVRIYDEIGVWGVDAEAFAADVADITASTIEVAINSPGGSVFQGLAIYNALRTHPARVVTRVDGLAASAASFIAQAGDERVMVESSQMMIHNAMATAFGSADDFREIAEFLDMQSVNIAELYASRSDVPAERFAEMMNAETWMTAAEAVAEGLADRVLVPERQASNTSPQAALDSAAASAAADVDAASVDEQYGQRSAVARSINLRRVVTP